MAAAALWIALALVALQQPPRYTERVDVTRVLVDVRAVDGAGRPLRDLTADDFDVKIDGRRARVDSVEWTGRASTTPVESRATGHSLSPPPQGRLIVLLFQKSLEGSRIIGLMRMLIDWQPFLDGLTPLDRVAVLSYDSHLKVWTDFTTDLERVKKALQRGILFETPPALSQNEGPSLLERLSVDQARRTYTIERALIRIAEALRPLPGPKSLVMIGHGFGELTRSGVMMRNEYEQARDALVAARASVISLDVTQADSHSLEAGLKLVSEDTGGFYASTFHFPALALDRVAGALAAHYVLFVEAPTLAPGHHRLSVEVKGRKGEVLATRDLVIEGPTSK